MASSGSRQAALAAFLGLALLLCPLPAGAFRVEADDLPTGLPSNINLYSIAWNPSGSMALAVGDGRSAAVYSDPTGSFRRLDAPSAPEFLLGVAWNPDSSFAMAVGSSGGAVLFNGRSMTPVNTGTTKYLYDVKWAPDGSWALAVGADGTILRYSGGAFAAVASGTDRTLYKASVNPKDQSALVVGVNSTFLKVGPDGAVVKLPFEGDFTLHSVAWNPQGTLAVIAGANGIVATYDGAAVGSVNEGTPNVFLDACWKPDGSQALICGDTGIILRYREGRLNYVDPGIRSLLQGIAYRPDGSYALAVGNKAKCVRYPAKPASKEPGLLDSPAVLIGMVAAVAVILAVTGYIVLAARRGRRGSERARRRGMPTRKKKR